MFILQTHVNNRQHIKKKTKEKNTHNDTIKHETRLDSSQESFCFVIVHKLKRTTNVIQMGSTFIEYIFIYFFRTNSEECT